MKQLKTHYYRFMTTPTLKKKRSHGIKLRDTEKTK